MDNWMQINLEAEGGSEDEWGGVIDEYIKINELCCRTFEHTLNPKTVLFPGENLFLVVV